MKKNLILAVILATALTLSACEKTQTGSEAVTSPASEDTTISSESPSSTTESTSVSEAQMPEDNTEASLLDEFKKSFSETAVIAVALVGGAEEGTPESVKDCVKRSGLAEKYDFVNEICDDNIVFMSGTEVYCVIPSESVSELSVNKVEYDEDGVPAKEAYVYSGNNKPFILVCNVSDIMANSLITVVTGDNVKEYSPSISLKDGTLYIPEGEKEIFDFSMNDFVFE